MDRIFKNESEIHPKNANDDSSHEPNTRNIGWENLDTKKYVLWNTVVWTLQDGSVYPLDLVKTRLQVQGVSDTEKHNTKIETSTKYASTWDALKQIGKQEGFRGYYRGFGTQTVGTIPTQIIYFGGYEFSKFHLNNAAKFLGIRKGQSLEFAVDSIAGASAELMSACVWVPADIIVQRLQIQNPNLPTLQKRYSGSIGHKGFYRGIGPTMATFVPHGAVQFASYQFVKKSIYALAPEGFFRGGEEEPEEGKIVRPILLPLGYHSVNFVAGLAAGTIAAIVTNPMDVAKTRIQTQDFAVAQRFLLEHFPHRRLSFAYPEVSVKYKGTLRTIREEGAKALTKGMTARIVGGAPAAGIGFLIYELIKMLSVKA